MMLADMLRDNRLREAETQVFGEYLYDVLLNEAGEKIAQWLDEKPPAFLRVELHFADGVPKWLRQLPWEYLYRPSRRGEAGYFLASKQRLALVRCPFVGKTRSLGVAAGEQLRILVVACSPANLETLEFGGFIEGMKELTKNITLTTLITRHVSDVNIASAESPNPEATFENFTAAMSHKPHIVHFLGHGRVDSDGGSIAFVKSNYNADWVEQKDLQPVFEESEVRLAFLQACETAASGDAAVAYRALSSVAGALADTDIPAIVAMQAKIQVGPASSFASRFYQSIVKDRLGLFRAMQVARTQAGDAARIPVLYLRYAPDRRDQADLLFEDAPPENKRPGPSRGDAVNIDGPKCPWCFEELTPQQLTGARCPYCGSDLCCPKCGTPAQGPFPKDILKTFCTKHGCRDGLLFRWVEPQAPPVPTGEIVDLSRTERPGAPNASDKSREQTFGRERQKDPFFAEPASEKAKGNGV